MKILFFHMNQLGDLLFSLPVLSAARKEWPEARVYCAVRPSLIPLIEASGFADAVIPRLKGGFMQKLRFTASVWQEGMDKGIFFSESPESLLLGFAGGVKERIGFSTASLSFLLTGKARRSGVPSLANNKNLGLKAGLKNIPEDYSGLVKVPSSVEARILDWLKSNGIETGKLVVLAPGASKKRRSKHWQAVKWKALAGNIAAKGFTPVYCGAPSEKEELETLAEGKAKVFTAEGGILELAALLKAAKLFIGIDSGAMHLAASLGTKVTALFGQTDPFQVGPMPLAKNLVIKKDSMEDISAEEVWEKVTAFIA